MEANYEYEAIDLSEKNSESVREMMLEYCGAVDMRLVILLFVPMIMWILDPALNRKLDELVKKGKINHSKKNYIKMMYKWIGIGLLFIVQLGISIPLLS